MIQRKKSALYQGAMVAVIEYAHMTANDKIAIIDQLLADQRVAVFNEQALEPLPEEDEL